jgi:hypothetical protein
MAKFNVLQVLNRIQENLGENRSTGLTALSGMNLLIFNTMNEVLYEISQDYKYDFLETEFSFPLVTNTATYTSTQTIGMFDFDRSTGSFRYNEERPIPYFSWQRFNREFPTRTSTGVPSLIYYWGGYFRPYPIPASSENGKIVYFKGWTHPTMFSTATATGTCSLPEGFEITLLADYVTYKILHYRGNPEWQIFYNKVFGSSDGKIEGSLNALKRLHGSPVIDDGSIVAEQMNSSGYAGGFVQRPITG